MQGWVGLDPLEESIVMGNKAQQEVGYYMLAPAPFAGQWVSIPERNGQSDCSDIQG